jgi:hypothetical protein
LPLTALRFAFGRKIEAQNFHLTTKFDMKNETTINHQTPPDAKRMLCAGQLTCDKCQLKKRYSTGGDEYPAYTTIEYCSKGHWENGDIPSAEDIDNWSNCADFLPCT